MLFNNLHECMGCIGAVKICVLIIIKKSWQRKVERERFSPYQSEDPSRFELFCLYQNAYNFKAQKQLFNLSIYRTVSEKISWSNYSYSIELNKYANISNQQQGLSYYPLV